MLKLQAIVKSISVTANEAANEVKWTLILGPGVKLENGRSV